MHSHKTNLRLSHVAMISGAALCDADFFSTRFGLQDAGTFGFAVGERLGTYEAIRGSLIVLGVFAASIRLPRIRKYLRISQRADQIHCTGS